MSDDIKKTEQLAKSLVNFAETDNPKTTGALPSGRLSLLRGEREQFVVMDGDPQPTYDEEGNFCGCCEEPIEVIDVSLLDEDEK